jgi:hypothetical protein
MVQSTLAIAKAVAKIQNENALGLAASQTMAGITQTDDAKVAMASFTLPTSANPEPAQNQECRPAFKRRAIIGYGCVRLSGCGGALRHIPPEC